MINVNRRFDLHREALEAWHIRGIQIARAMALAVQRVTCERRSAKLRGGGGGGGMGNDRVTLKEEQLSAIEKFVSGQDV